MSVFESSFDDPLGMWASDGTTASRAPSAVSFGIETDRTTASSDRTTASRDGTTASRASAPVTETVYRVNLPAQPAEAHAEFDHNQAVFERVGAELDNLPARLENFALRSAQSSASKAGASFAVPSQENGGNPDDDLFALLMDADREVSRSQAGQVSFGAGEVLSETWQDAKGRFEALLTQIDHDALHLAWVETSIAGQLIARTIVDWSGDAQTAWLGGSASDVEQTALHQRALASVTQTRLMRLRLFVTVAGGAARVAGLMAAPGGALLALPAVYQYVIKILAQARELPSIPTN